MKRKAAKPASRKAAKKQQAVKKQGIAKAKPTKFSRTKVVKKNSVVSELRTLLSKATLLRKAAGKKASCNPKKLMELCQHFAGRGARVTFALGTCPRIRHRVWQDWTRHRGTLPKMAPYTLTSLNTKMNGEAPVVLELRSSHGRLIKTGTITRAQAEVRRQGWTRVFKEASIVVA